MDRFFWLRDAPELPYTGYFQARHRWGLPGVSCSTCGVTWGGAGIGYPSVDLSSLAGEDMETPRVEPYEEFVRLREKVRPFVPAGAQFEPGEEYGPLVGTATGTFGPLFIQNPWQLLMHREALERMVAAGVRGLRGYRTELRFRRKHPPELMEMEILPQGRLHPDCLPADRRPPCPRCGWVGTSRPEELILEASSLPGEVDLFRLADFETTMVCSERFQEVASKLGLDGVRFREVAVR